MNKERETMTVEEACRRMGCSKTTLYLGIKTGKVPGSEVGGRRIIPRAAFEEFLQTGKVPEAKPLAQTPDLARLMKDLRISQLQAQKVAIDTELRELTMEIVSTRRGY